MKGSLVGHVQCQRHFLLVTTITLNPIQWSEATRYMYLRPPERLLSFFFPRLCCLTSSAATLQSSFPPHWLPDCTLSWIENYVEVWFSLWFPCFPIHVLDAHHQIAPDISDRCNQKHTWYFSLLIHILGLICTSFHAKTTLKWQAYSVCWIPIVLLSYGEKNECCTCTG